MDSLDEAIELYNDEKIKDPIPVLFADSEIGEEKIRRWKEMGFRCGYVKIPVVAREDVILVQKLERCIYPQARKVTGNDERIREEAERIRREREEEERKYD